MTWFESLTKVETFSNNGLITYLLTFLTVAISLYYFFKRQQKISLIEKIPGPKALPILGNALEVNVTPREIFSRLVNYPKILEQHWSIFRVWAFSRPYIFLYNSSTLETILNSSTHIDKSRDYLFLHPWLGTGLLTSTGKKWHSRRKMLTPAFHFKILEDFMDVFNNQSEKLVSKLKSKADGKPFDMFPFITLCTLDIILESAMGRNINAQDNSESEYVKAVYRITAIIQLRQTRPWFQPNILFKLSGYEKEQRENLDILHGFSYETIRQRRKEFEQLEQDKRSGKDELGRKRKLAFLDLLLENGSSLSDEDIREEVDTFMFEGHDTTAAALNWSLYLIGSHPEVQKEIQEELDSIFGDSDRKATSADLREMKYLECCIKEALRLFPSVPFIAREIQEEVVIDGYRIPPGTTAMIITYRLHRDPAHFPEPELFKPERFFPENCVNRHPYAYVPFSAGPRNCIGKKFAIMEEKVVLSSIFRNYWVESTVRRENLKILGELILRPEDGNILKLTPRKK